MVCLVGGAVIGGVLRGAIGSKLVDGRKVLMWDVVTSGWIAPRGCRM
jgi:hypothetical protein